MASILSWAKKAVKDVENRGQAVAAQVNPLDGGRTYNTVRQQGAAYAPQPNRSIAQQAVPLAQHAAQQALQSTRIGQAANLAGRVAPKIPEFSNSSPMRFANNLAIRPLKTTDANVSKVLQGKNPYKGNLKQQLGQASQDAINVASVLPVGKAAELASKGLPVAQKVVAGAKLGAKTGVGFGGAQGVSTSLQKNLNPRQALITTAENAGLGLVGGTVLGAGAPAAGALARNGAKNVGKAAKAVGEVVAPKFNGLSAKQIVKNPEHLQAMDAYQQSVYNQRPLPVGAQNKVSQALNQASKETGIDFVSGSPLERADRIANYQEQHAGALPAYQAHLARPRLATHQGGGGTPFDNKLGRAIAGENNDARIKELQNIVDNPASKSIPAGVYSDAQRELYALKNNKPVTKQAAVGNVGEFTDNVAPNRSRPQIPKQEVKTPAPTAYKRTRTGVINQELNPAQLTPEQAAKLPAQQQTNVQLNRNRLNIGDNGAKNIVDHTAETIQRMSNKDVEAIAKGAGLDTKTHNIQQTRQKIAEQLNVRQSAISLQNEAEQAARAGDTARAAELLKQSAEQGRISRTQGTDLARQLQARRIIANELDTPQQRIFKLLDEAGVNPDVYTKKLAEIDMNDPKAVVAAYREMVPAHASQWLDTVRYNSMLSSPLTQAVNIFGNAQNVALVAPIEKTLKGIVDATRVGLFGGDRQFATSEGGAYAKGVATNVANASRNFVDALKGEGKYANTDLQEFNMPLATKGVAGAAYKGLSFPMRVLDGMDKFFRTLAEEGEGAALNAREKAGIAINGNREAMKEAEASYRVFQTEVGEPGQGVINNAFDEFAQLAMKGRSSKNPIVSTVSKFTIPFVKTVNNIAKQGMVDFSPAGYANMVGNNDKVTAFTRATMGTAVFGASAALVGSGKMTWAEPRDADERARFRKEGKQPYAVKMGGKWVNFSKLTPSVAFPMAMTAALHDAMESKKLDQGNVDAILEAVSKYGTFLADQSYAKSVGDTLGAIGGDKEAVARAVSNNVQQVVPFRALTGWIARMSDDTERKVDTTAGYFDQQVQSLMQQYPVLRQKTPTRDYKGEPIAANNQVLNGISPVKITDDRGVSPLDAELDALKTAKYQQPKNSKRQQAINAKKAEANLTTNQKKLIELPEYKALSTKDKQSALNKLKGDTNAVYAPSAAKIGKELTDRQSRLNAGSPNLKDYLTTTASSGGSKAKTYQEKQAKFDAEVKAGKLSRYQQQTQGQSLAREKITSTYSKDMNSLYGKSKTFIADYLANDPDGNRVAKQLKELDQKLVDAGFVTTPKFKYGFGSGKSASRKTGTGSRGGTKRSKVPKIAKIKTPKVTTKAPKFSLNAPKTKSFKNSSKKLPTYAAKTPKITVKKA